MLDKIETHLEIVWYKANIKMIGFVYPLFPELFEKNTKKLLPWLMADKVPTL